MDINTDVSMTAGMFSFNKAEEAQSNKVLGALGMTPETVNAEKEIDESMKQGIAQASGQGVNLDLKA